MKHHLSTDDKLAIAVAAYAVGGPVTSDRTYLVGAHGNPFPSIIFKKEQ